MDFTRPHIQEESVTTISNVGLIDVVEHDSAKDDRDQNKAATDDATLDQMVLQAANQAARELFLSNLPKEHQNHDKLVDASLYGEHVTPLKEIIHEGDLVVIMEAFDCLSFVYAKKGTMYFNRNGHFPHESFIGKPFGSKIRSKNNRGYGFVYLLKPTVELWARSLNHRTQIVQDLDQSQIVFQLYLRPNMTVVESGTGSGAMSHAFMRTIAPHGHLHTYEFNQVRAETAAKEFASNGASHLVTVHHRDVCAEEQGKGGFNLPKSSVDAVFLDLPEPWHAVPHAAFVLKSNARIATYSPCVEQTQRTVEALEKACFHSIKTMEYRLQEHYVDEVEYEGPPRAKRPKFEAVDHAAIAASLSAGNDATNEGTGGLENEEKDGLEEKIPETSKNADNGNELDRKAKKMVVARPFVMMRGHTAFLTFATAPIQKFHDAQSTD